MIQLSQLQPLFPPACQAIRLILLASPMIKVWPKHSYNWPTQTSVCCRQSPSPIQVRNYHQTKQTPCKQCGRLPWASRSNCALYNQMPITMRLPTARYNLVLHNGQHSSPTPMIGSPSTCFPQPQTTPLTGLIPPSIKQ